MSRAERRAEKARSRRLAKVRAGLLEAEKAGIVELQRRDGQLFARVDLRGSLRLVVRAWEDAREGSAEAGMVAEARALLAGVWTPEAEDRAATLLRVVL